MTKTYFNFFMVCSLVLFISCGEKKKFIAIEAEEEVSSDFSTQLSEDLLVAGYRCEGDEVIVLGEKSYGCFEDHWLLSLDREYLLVELIEAYHEGQFTFYDLVPVSVVSKSEENRLKQIQIRLHQSGEGTAVFKNQRN